MTTAAHNGRTDARRVLHDDSATPGRGGPPGVGTLTGLVRRLAGRAVPPADIDEPDPDYIRETLPRLWLAASLWYRGEVRGLGNVPENGPVLLVGNHSGGNLTPDTLVFTLAFSTYFGVERAFHQLAHNLVLSFPGLSFLRRYGTVAASPENARQALRSGAAVLVYPGWRSRRACRSCPWWPSAARRRRCSCRAASTWPARSAWTGCSG
jgi:hypothetical protein